MNIGRIRKKREREREKTNTENLLLKKIKTSKRGNHSMKYEIHRKRYKNGVAIEVGKNKNKNRSERKISKAARIEVGEEKATTGNKLPSLAIYNKHLRRHIVVKGT